MAKKLPEDTHNYRFNTVNFIVCLPNVAVPAIVWIYSMKGEYKVVTFAFYIEQLSLVVTFIALIFGISRLVRLAKSLRGQMVNKVMITMHIVAYLAIIIVNALKLLSRGLRVYKIETICLLAVYCVCTVIFGLIVNQIVTKIQAFSSYSESIAHTLMTAAAATDLVNQGRQSINNF